MNPHTMGKLFLEGKMDIFAIFDGLYCTIVIGLLILVFMPLFRTLNNVIHQTDEILRLKKGKCSDDEASDDDKDAESGSKKKTKALTWS